MHDLRQLHYFLAIAETGNFRRAAEQAHISQPALSQRMKALEEDLAVSLFTRSARGVRLTAAGEAFARGARQVLRDAEQAIAGARLADRAEDGALTIAFNEIGGQQPVVGTVLALFRAAFPRVVVSLRELGRAAQHEGLRTGAIDAAFHYSLPGAATGFATEVLDTRSFGLILPEGHALAREPALAMGHLADQPMALMGRDVNEETYDGIVAAFARTATPLQVTAEASSDAGLLTLVRAGFGLGIAMLGHRRCAWDGLAMRRVSGLDMAKDFVMTWNEANRLPSLAKFVALVRETRRHAELAPREEGALQ